MKKTEKTAAPAAAAKKKTTSSPARAKPAGRSATAPPLKAKPAAAKKTPTPPAKAKPAGAAAAKPAAAKPAASVSQPQGKHGLAILHEDQWILVVNKPSGMLSIGFPGFHGSSAQDILTEMHKKRGKQRIAVVHRLDRDTSGVMMFACSAEAKKAVMDDWQAIVSERTYRCVCSRLPRVEPLPDSGVINAPLAYNRHEVAFVPRPNDHKMLKEAEKAITRFKVIERGELYDLVECELDTGRKNQIRAHMAHLGHPVVGDDTYTGLELTEKDEKATASPIGRLALHARVLAFTHPFTGELHRFEIAEPDSFGRLVAQKGRSSAKAGSGLKAGLQAGAKTGTSAGKAAPGTRASGKSGAVEEKGPRNRKRLLSRKNADNVPGKDGYQRKENIEDITDLIPLPRRSRVKPAPDTSLFIPKKQTPGPRKK